MYCMQCVEEMMRGYRIRGVVLSISGRMRGCFGSSNLAGGCAQTRTWQGNTEAQTLDFELGWKLSGFGVTQERVMSTGTRNQSK